MDRKRGLLDRLVAWSPVLLLGGLAALTYWLDAQVQTPAARADGSTRHDPDIFLEDFRALTFDAQRPAPRRCSRPSAPSISRTTTASISSRPQLTLTEPGSPTMTRDGRPAARFRATATTATFRGNVKATRDAEPEAAEATARPNGPGDAHDRFAPRAAPRSSASKPTRR